MRGATPSPSSAAWSPRSPATSPTCPSPTSPIPSGSTRQVPKRKQWRTPGSRCGAPPRSLRHGSAIREDAHPVVRHLSAAADHLAAARDLLHTHVTTDPAGLRTGSSRWAPAITSEPVTAALHSELAQHARTLAPWASQLTMTVPPRSGMPAPQRLILHNAISGLWITAAAVHAAQRDHPPAAGARRLLAAIPAAIPPLRHPPGDGEHIPQLCDGLVVTAERLRHAARASSSWPAISASWRHNALASAITSHASEIILRTLAERATQLRLDPAIAAQLHPAADAMSLTWPAWRAVASQWDILSTGAHPGPVRTPAAGDFADLALRTGRLAYDSPQWTPAHAGASLIRSPAGLAPAPDTLGAVLSAVHHAADAISRTGTADQQASHAAAAGSRLYLPTRLMPEEYDIPHPYTRAPHQHTDALHAAYSTALSTSARITSVLDDLAIAVGAPSTLLAHTRSFERLQADAHRREDTDLAYQQTPPPAPAAAPPQPGTQIGSLIESMQITDPAMLLRAAAIDQASRNLLAEASAKTRKRDSNAAAQPAQPIQPASRRSARAAGKDLPRHRASPSPQLTHDQANSTAAPANTTTARSPAQSRTHRSPKPR